jgi:hypothetical protein
MLSKILLSALAAFLAAVLVPSVVHAYGAAHVGYTHVGPGGVYHTGRTVAAGPGGVYAGGRTTAVGAGGGYRSGGAAVGGYGGAAAGGYRYGGAAVGGYRYIR